MKRYLFLKNVSTWIAIYAMECFMVKQYVFFTYFKSHRIPIIVWRDSTNIFYYVNNIIFNGLFIFKKPHSGLCPATLVYRTKKSENWLLNNRITSISIIYLTLLSPGFLTSIMVSRQLTDTSAFFLKQLFFY